MPIKEQRLLDRISEVRQMESLAISYNEEDKKEVLIILDKKTKKTNPIFEKYKMNCAISKEVAIALAKSQNTPMRIIDLLVDMNIDGTKTALMSRKDLHHDNCYDLLTKTKDSDFEKAFANPEIGINIHNAIKKNILDNAIADIRIGRKLKKHQVLAFSCTDDQALLEKIFLANSVPEEVVVAIVNNPHIKDTNFKNKCFALGCDYRKLNTDTPEIIDEVYRTAADAITEIQSTTQEEKRAQLDAKDTLIKLICGDKLTGPQREDLYIRLDKMPSSDINRSTLLKELLKTERSNKILEEFLYSTVPIMYKRIACNNMNCTSKARESFIHEEVKTLCERLPTSISSYNFLSMASEHIQFNLNDYMSLLNKHFSHTTNEKLEGVIKAIASSRATPLKVLEILADVEPYPNIKKMASMNYAYKKNVTQKGDFEILEAVFVNGGKVTPNHKYNDTIKNVLNTIIDKNKDIAIIKLAKEAKEKFIEAEKNGYPEKLDEYDFLREEMVLLKKINKECNGSLFTFYQNVDRYNEEYNQLLALKENEKEIEKEEER